MWMCSNHVVKPPSSKLWIHSIVFYMIANVVNNNMYFCSVTNKPISSKSIAVYQFFLVMLLLQVGLDQLQQKLCELLYHFWRNSVTIIEVNKCDVHGILL